MWYKENRLDPMDNSLAIQVENISKRYRIGLKEKKHVTFSAQIGSYLTKPFRNYLNYRKLYRFEGKRQEKMEMREAPDLIWALKNITFDIMRGETVGVIGRNGAGKSTLLKILSKIIEPASGRALIRGRVSSLLEVGTGFHPELTGRENIYLNGVILGMRKFEIDRKFDEIVNFSGVEKFIDTPVKRYSSGMTVRLAFSVAAHLEPEILIVDEVLAVGDAAFQAKCLGRMETAAKSGRTILFVSHNMAAVSNLCSKSILLEDGRVKSIGPTKTVIEEYLRGLESLSDDDLENRTDRSGAGQVRITKTEYLDSNYKKIDCGQTGKDLIIRIHYSCADSETFRNCRFSVVVRRNEKNFLLLSTELTNTKTIEIRDKGYIDFTLPNLMLTESVYLLTVFVESNKVVQDWVMDAVKLQVVDGDYYGTGRNVPERSFNGDYVLVPFHWRLSK
jgi:lipopolysaccharide transport system ATP-binding protein